MTTPSQWRLDTDTWNQLCTELEPVTAVDRPYESIRVGYHDNTDELSAYVESPQPDLGELPEPEKDNENAGFQIDGWEDDPTNDIAALTPELTEQLWAVLNTLQNTGVTITEESITASLGTSLFTPAKSVGVFYLTRTLNEDEAGLYTQFRELMVTLGYADDPTKVTHGQRLAPMKDDLSDHEWDLGMSATAYRMVPDPHTYWENCETLADYIDMCVDNGADRADLESRELYYHHFHPDTRLGELTTEQEAALSEWQSALSEMFIPHLELDDAVIHHGVMQASFNEDGTGELTYSVTVGDDLFNEYSE